MVSAKFISLMILIGLSLFLVKNAVTEVDDKKALLETFMEDPVKGTASMTLFAISSDGLTPTIIYKDWLPPYNQTWESTNVNGTNKSTAPKLMPILEDFPMFDSKYEYLTILILTTILVAILRVFGVFEKLGWKGWIYLVIGWIILFLVLWILMKLMFFGIYKSSCEQLGQTIDTCMVIRHNTLMDMKENNLFLPSILMTLFTGIVITIAFFGKKDNE